MNKERFLLVVSGPSGSGKDTVVNHLAHNYDNIFISVSATTREMRHGEKCGENYFFLTQDDFKQKIQNNEFLEYANYCENYYGTLTSEVDKRISMGKTVVLVIEVQGAANVKRIYPNCTTVFIRPPSYEELSRRLHSRGTEDENKITARLKRAVEEMEYAADYDFVVVNDTIENCAEEICTILKLRQQ